MESELNVVFSYLKCLQYLQLRSYGNLSQSQISQLKLFIENCSKEFSLVPEEEKRFLDTFLLDHRVMFPSLDIPSLSPDPVYIENRFSQELSFPKDAPFFADSSDLCIKVQKLPLNAAMEYMDWCWEMNPSSFVSILVELLECDKDLPKDKFVSWIADALCVEDMVLLEFIKHSRGRLRDICERNRTFSSAFTTALSKALHKGKFQDDRHSSNLRRYVECFRLACLMPP